MEERLEAVKWRLHLCAAMIGGWFGGYMVLRFAHFSSAATVNIIELLTGIAQGKWQQVLLRLGAVAVYAGTVLLAAWLPCHRRVDLRLLALPMDALAAVLLGLLSDAAREGEVFLCLFTMALHWIAFSGKRGYPCSTIFSTNNFRQFLDAWAQIYLNHDPSHHQRMRLYGGTLLSFHTGVALACLLWAAGIGRQAIFGALVPAALALRWLRPERCLRQEAELEI